MKEGIHHHGLPIYSDLCHQTLVLILNDTIEALTITVGKGIQQAGEQHTETVEERFQT